MAGAPVIEGALKNTINALGFGLILTTLAVNFGKFFLPNFFPYMMGAVIFVEAVLFSLDKPKEIYDKFQPAGIKGRHTIEGAGSPQITVSAPDQDPEAASKKRDKFKDKKTKKDQKGRRESGVPGSPSRQSPRESLSVPVSPGMEAVGEAAGSKETQEKGKEKTEKEKKKEEEKEKKKEKGEEKERQKAEKKEEKERAKAESEDDKGEKATWRKRLTKKQASE